MNSYKSLESFIKHFNRNEYDENDLIISDIDGVFFKGIYDPREIIGIISRKNLKLFKTLLETECAFWIFTNRLNFFRKFPFIKQLSKTMSDFSNSKIKIFTSSSDFLDYNNEKYAIILNAKKPKFESQKVVEKGIDDFKKVIYIGSQDTPFYYTDKKLLSLLAKQRPLDDFTFIEINPWKINSL